MSSRHSTFAMLCLWLAAASWMLGCSSDVDADEGLAQGLEAQPVSWHPDQGLFWFGPGNQKEPAKSKSRFYDPTKPTLIYVHGWQPNRVAEGRRETFNYKNNDPVRGIDIDLAALWIDRGWNVGLYYWDRLSDDGEFGLRSVIGHPRWVEDKIWTTRGEQGMRWRRDDGSFETIKVPTKSASDMFFEDVRWALRDYRGPNIRVIGHSLGHQMAVRLVEQIHDGVRAGRVAPALMPKRLALLDPFWTDNANDDGSRVGANARVRDAVYKLSRAGVAIEHYRSSRINTLGATLGLADRNEFVEQVSAFSVIHPEFAGFVNERSAHAAALNLYLWSMQFQSPPLCDGRPGGALSAAATDDFVRFRMGAATYYEHDGGELTADVLDDCFVERPRQLTQGQPVSARWSRIAGKTHSVFALTPPGTARVRFFLNYRKLAKVSGRSLFEHVFQIDDEDLGPGRLVVTSAYDEDDRLLGTTEGFRDFGSGPSAYLRQVEPTVFDVGVDDEKPEGEFVSVSVSGVEMKDVATNAVRAKNILRFKHPLVDGQRPVVIRTWSTSGRLVGEYPRVFNFRPAIW